MPESDEMFIRSLKRQIAKHEELIEDRINTFRVGQKIPPDYIKFAEVLNGQSERLQELIDERRSSIPKKEK